MSQLDVDLSNVISVRSLSRSAVEMKTAVRRQWNVMRDSNEKICRRAIRIPRMLRNLALHSLRGNVSRKQSNVHRHKLNGFITSDSVRGNQSSSNMPSIFDELVHIEKAA